MSQFSSFNQYSLSNQLVKLEQAWKDINNNQIYQTGQAVLWRYRMEKIRIASAGDRTTSMNKEYRVSLSFEQPAFFVLSRAWLYINDSGPYKYTPNMLYAPDFPLEIIQFVDINFAVASGDYTKWKSSGLLPMFRHKQFSTEMLYNWDLQLEFITSMIVTKTEMEVISNV